MPIFVGLVAAAYLAAAAIGGANCELAKDLQARQAEESAVVVEAEDAPEIIIIGGEIEDGTA